MKGISTTNDSIPNVITYLITKEGYNPINDNCIYITNLKKP